jgi:hypothetical protein
MVYAAELVPRMPMFNNLVDLEFLSPWSIDLDCAALWTLLQKSPCLKALKYSGDLIYNVYYLVSVPSYC